MAGPPVIWVQSHPPVVWPRLKRAGGSFESEKHLGGSPRRGPLSRSPSTRQPCALRAVVRALGGGAGRAAAAAPAGGPGSGQPPGDGPAAPRAVSLGRAEDVKRRPAGRVHGPRASLSRSLTFRQQPGQPASWQRTRTPETGRSHTICLEHLEISTLTWGSPFWTQVPRGLWHQAPQCHVASGGRQRSQVGVPGASPGHVLPALMGHL